MPSSRSSVMASRSGWLSALLPLRISKLAGKLAIRYALIG
ncbi:Lipid kinase yegS [Salmonella enterica subsp. enterica serovar Typhi str. P-stx-12]|nr:Lipid kinase yegS [Salmonella enterica subsp. enterica serovar Typhi str. P-stx-12]AXR55916.1 hypothetical protein CJP42_1796 [Salmonella enterica subsp. enterica serovar Typhi]